MAQSSDLCPKITEQTPVSFYKLEKSERERIKAMRDAINRFTGVLGFSAQNQNLFCNVCKYEIPYNGLDRIPADVNTHMESPNHQSALRSYVQKESTNINQTIANAIASGQFVQVMEGQVKCTICNDEVMSDSLSNLKRHVLLDTHKFAAAGIKVNPYGPSSKKMIELVIEHEQLEFANSEDGKPKVRCIKCDRLMPRDHSSIVRHLASKKHADAVVNDDLSDDDDDETNVEQNNETNEPVEIEILENQNQNDNQQVEINLQPNSSNNNKRKKTN